MYQTSFWRVSLHCTRWILNLSFWDLKLCGGNLRHTALGNTLINIAPFTDFQKFWISDSPGDYSKKVIIFRTECNFPFSAFIRPSGIEDGGANSPKSVNKRKECMILHMAPSGGVVQNDQSDSWASESLLVTWFYSLWVSTLINK